MTQQAKRADVRARVTVPEFRARKDRQEKLTMATAYDATFARMLDEGGVDSLLVGDSLGMVVQGLDSTLPVTLDEMIYHCRAVARGTNRAQVVGDMPFMSYQVSVEQGLSNAGRMMKEGGCHAVKLEGGAIHAELVRRLVGRRLCCQIDVSRATRVPVPPDLPSQGLGSGELRAPRALQTSSTSSGNGTSKKFTPIPCLENWRIGPAGRLPLPSTPVSPIPRASSITARAKASRTSSSRSGCGGISTRHSHGSTNSNPAR